MQKPWAGGINMERRAERIALIVEDNTQLLDAYVSTVQIAGMRPLAARDLATARALVKENRPDIGIIDMHLPDGNGIDLVEEARDVDPGALLLLISGLNETGSTVAAMRAGASDVIDKPIQRSELIRRLAWPPDTLEVDDTSTLDLASWRHVHRIAARATSKADAARRLGIDRGTLAHWLSRPRPIR